MSDTAIANPLVLNRICRIADDIARAHPDGHELVKEIFSLATDLVREELRPLPIETAPTDPERKLLLYCPEQGGWIVGEWLVGRWTASWTWDLLHPTHWTECPPEPLEPANEPLPGIGPT